MLLADNYMEIIKKIRTNKSGAELGLTSYYFI
ncbi:hypothetical protein EMIT0133MI5_50064 [Bacillus velezensis]